MSAMRFFLTLILALTVPATAALSQAANPAPQPETASLATSKQRLDALFMDLKKQRDENEARELADRIRLEWQDSGSATVNLLMQSADKAITDDKKPVALDILDQVIALAPNYVEGWNRRATLHFQMGNYRKSMSDIYRVLAIEPRHFGAIAGMATMLEAAGKNELAMRAWQQFLDVYPSDRKAQEQFGELAEKLAGSRT
ncbi:hypothetical protein [Sinorhizobium fredii]|uniref:hypothetical protein n=1 Tax=Rhizobium fredii TaxID=380 RepID=UPI001297DB26|nr:hypothetical protein [Sinorhizobium fredii]MQW95265.1 hypothetical protein [Sinorhizobium fredii]UTY50562.1 hypothetical protein EPK84_29330 [Sinorhizobium fredii]